MPLPIPSHSENVEFMGPRAHKDVRVEGFTHQPRVTKTRAALHVHVRTLTQLATRGF